MARTKETTVHCSNPRCRVAMIRRVGHPDTKPRAKPLCYSCQTKKEAKAHKCYKCGDPIGSYGVRVKVRGKLRHAHSSCVITR